MLVQGLRSMVTGMPALRAWRLYSLRSKSLSATMSDQWWRQGLWDAEQDLTEARQAGERFECLGGQ